MASNNPVPHIAVIGAGIVGSSIAFHLARRGARLSLIDAGEPGGATSAVSFAWINGRDKNPRHYHDLNRRSLDMWDRFSRLLGGVGLTWGGELRWATTPEEGEAMSRRVRELQSWGYPIHLIDRDEMSHLEPGLSFDAFTAASFTPIDGHVDTKSVVQACVSALSGRDAEILPNTRVTGISLGPSGVQTISTDQGDISCDAVVLAGGPDTPALAALAGIEIPMYHTFGASIFTEPIPPVFHNIAVVHTPRDLPTRTNFRQLPDGSVQIHGGSHGTVHDAGSLGKTDEEVERVFEAVAQFLPALKDATIREVRQGRRPIPNDGQPILGFTEAVPNLYMAVMHSGVSLAPLAGEYAAVEILDGARIDFLEPYRLERLH